MQAFEIQQWESSTSDGRGPFVPDGATGYVLTDEAEAAVDEILEPYNNSSWYLDSLQHRWPGGPWSLICLDKEYPLAGHVGEARRDGIDLGPDFGFVPLARTPKPVPPNYCPGVGILVFRTKVAAQAMAPRSRLFELAWEAVKDLPTNRKWLVLIDALEQNWVETNGRDNRNRWIATRA